MVPRVRRRHSFATRVKALLSTVTTCQENVDGSLLEGLLIEQVGDTFGSSHATCWACQYLFPV